MGLDAFGRIFTFARETEDLYALQSKLKDGLIALDERLRQVEDRLIRLEAEQRRIVAEAKSAATGAATLIASAVISDAVTRVTRVEEGVRRLSSGPIQLVSDPALPHALSQPGARRSRRLLPLPRRRCLRCHDRRLPRRSRRCRPIGRLRTRGRQSSPQIGRAHV